MEKTKKALFLPSKKTILSILGILDASSKSIDEFHPLSDLSEALVSKYTQAKNRIEFCSILSGLFHNIFFTPDTKVTRVDLSQMIGNLSKVLSESRHFQLHPISTKRCYIQTDEDLLKQLLFILLYNISSLSDEEDQLIEIRSGLSNKLNGAQTSETGYLEIRYQLDEKMSKKESRPKVLVVDDEIAAASFLEKMLSNGGFNVECVYSGFQCLDYLKDNSVDLVILDIGMDAMKGSEVLISLRNRKKHKFLPVIIYTGLFTDDDIIRFKENYIKQQPFRILQKPESNEKFISSIKEMISMKQKSYELSDLSDKNYIESIQEDPVLRLGLFPALQIAKLLNIDVEMDASNIPKVVYLRFNPGQINQIDSPLIKAIGTVDQDSLEKIYHEYKHKIGNKLFLIIGDIRAIGYDLSLTQDPKQQDIIAAIEHCDKLAKSIGNDPA